MDKKDNVLPQLKTSEMAYLKNPGSLRHERLAYEKTIAEGKPWTGPVPPLQIKNPFNGEVIYAHPKGEAPVTPSSARDTLAPFGGSESMTRRDPRYYRVRWAASFWRAAFIACPLFVVMIAYSRSFSSKRRD